MTQAPTLRLHENFSCRVDYVGAEKQPVLIVDNYMHNAEALIGFGLLLFCSGRLTLNTFIRC